MSVCFRYTVNEILTELENADDGRERLIYVTPPNDLGDTDVDSDKSDDEHVGNLNHLGCNLLRSTCEVQTSDIPQVTHDEPSTDEQQPSSSKSSASIPFTLSDRPQRKRKQPTYFEEYYDENLTFETPTSDKKDVSKSKKQVKIKTSAKTKKQKTKETRDAQITQWKTEEPNFTMVMECDPTPSSDEAMECQSPIDFFSLFFDDQLLDDICVQSNLYASQKNVNLNLNRDELLVFLGGLLMSGYAKYPNKRMFWSTEDDTPSLLSESMRCNRFEQILRFLHLNDNSQIDVSDKLYKLRPYIDKLNDSFQYHGGLEENLSVDESMIPYYGRHYAKQFIRGKPIRFGFKNWALCASSGYLVSFDIYTGKDSNRENKFGLGGDVVMHLIEKAQIPGNSGHKLFIDNYFTSVPLIKHLAEIGICATGTLRADRTENCTVKSVQTVQKEKRGSFDFRSAENVLVVRWHDNSVCTVATNCENLSIGKTTRWSREQKSKIQVPQPTVFASYNKGMGGVDLLDQGIATYRTRIRQRKWWWPIFVYLFDACVVNAWLLNRKLLPAETATQQLLNFRRNLAITLLKKHGKPPFVRPVPKPLQGVRFDNFNHWPAPNATERRCGNCPGKAKFICTKCQVGLHPKCFQVYHTQ